MDVAPSRVEIDQRVAQVATGRFRRPILVLGIDGAYVPSRPEQARGRRPGQVRYRAKDVGLIPEGTVRLCVVGDDADWIWKYVQALFPDACQVLDYYQCSEYLHKMAYAQYGHTLPALEWVEAALNRLYMGHVGAVLGGLRRMQPTSEDAAKVIYNCWVHLDKHRSRTPYGKFCRGGYPLGSGGIKSSNKFICHVCLKRSSAWWYEVSSNQISALRCAKYNGT